MHQESHCGMLLLATALPLPRAVLKQLAGFSAGVETVKLDDVHA